MQPESIERRTIRKIRLRILPFLFILYVVAFLDRVNIGFAALTMNKALAITSQQFGLLAGIFFIGYFFFEIPSNILLHKLGARVWIARILVSWGLVSACNGLAQNATHLYIVRFLLGIAEAGFFPGMILYLTYWFRQREQAQAVALFMAALPVSNVIGAPISGLILDHAHWFGVATWRWLLALEALPAIVLGVATWLLLPNGPEDARFLDRQEKDWLHGELAQESAKQEPMSATRALMSGRVWHLTFVYFTLVVGLYVMSFWLPQVVKGLSAHYSNTTVGVLVTIPHAVGFVAMMLVSRHSDRTGERRWHAAVPAIAAATAMFTVGLVSSPLLSIAILTLMASGIYSFFGPFWALPNRFLTGYAAASGIALINSVGNLGGFVGPYMIGSITTWTGSNYWGL
ncbi:MAG TPA: MFS transporter, partial [Bryobacteraceae bacterium]|nr:MFS transporter [Bryobacteraceae bacterium]